MFLKNNIFYTIATFISTLLLIIAMNACLNVVENENIVQQRVFKDSVVTDTVFKDTSYDNDPRPPNPPGQ